MSKQGKPRRPQRLLNSVLDYNFSKAQRRAQAGLTPFKTKRLINNLAVENNDNGSSCNTSESEINLSWDNFIYNMSTVDHQNQHQPQGEQLNAVQQDDEYHDADDQVERRPDNHIQPQDNEDRDYPQSDGRDERPPVTLESERLEKARIIAGQQHRGHNISFESNLTHASALDFKLRNRPDEFVAQSKRVTTALIARIPDAKKLQELDSKTLEEVHKRMVRGELRINKYLELLDEAFDDDEFTLETEAMQLLEFEHSRLANTQHEVACAAVNLSKRIKNLAALESQDKGLELFSTEPMAQSELLQADLNRPPDINDSNIRMDRLSLESSNINERVRDYLHTVNITSSPGHEEFGGARPKIRQARTYQYDSQPQPASSTTVGMPSTIPATLLQPSPIPSCSPLSMPPTNDTSQQNVTLSSIPITTTSATQIRQASSALPQPLSVNNAPIIHATEAPSPFQSRATELLSAPPVQPPLPLTTAYAPQFTPNAPTTCPTATGLPVVPMPPAIAIQNTNQPIHSPLPMPALQPQVNEALVASTSAPQANPLPIQAVPHSMQYATQTVSRTTAPLLHSEPTESAQIQPRTTILERLIIEDMRNAEYIMQTHISPDLNNLEILGLEQKESKELSRLQTSLSDKLLKLDSRDPHTQASTCLQEQVLSVIEAARLWCNSLTQLCRQKELFSNSKGLSTPLDLKRFKGWDSELTIFEFFKLFELITKNVSNQDKSQYLYVNYLSYDIQRIVKHHQHNYHEMKKLLLKKFGMASVLLDNKKKQIKNLSLPSAGNKHQERQYLKNLTQILDQTISLVQDNGDEYPDIENTIYNYSFTTEIIRLLPSHLRKAYSRDYVSYTEDQFEGNELDGRESFAFFSRWAHRSYRSLEVELETFSERDQKDSKPPIQNPKRSLNLKNKSTRSTTQPRIQALDPSKWVKSVCFMHKELHKHVRDCKLGQCSVFLNAPPKLRLKKAKEFNLCPCCFLYKCPKMSSDGRCVFKSQLPVLVVCQACAVQGQDLNILLCENHKNDSPDARKALVDFLPGYEDSTSIKLLTYSMHNIDIPPQPGKSVDQRVFDVEEGKVLDRSDVLHKIVPPNPNDALYLLQMISFNGTVGCVLYDTGASCSAVLGSFADKVGFQEIDPTPQRIAVAGGETYPTGRGIYRITLGPCTDSGFFHHLTMLGMNTTTHPIPNYQLSELEREVKQAASSLPISKEKFPKFVGGKEVDIIVGISDSYLMPRYELTLPNGLMVYRSPLRDVFGSDLIFAGPHAEISRTHKLSPGINQFSVLFTQSFQTLRNSPLFDHEPLDSCLPLPLEKDLAPVDVTPLEAGIDFNIKQSCSCLEFVSAPLTAFCKCCYTPGFEPHPSNADLLTFPPDPSGNLIAPTDQKGLLKIKRPKRLEEALKEEEDMGSRITYRCPHCQDCEDCKLSDKTRLRSIREEREDHIIEQCIHIDLENKVTFSKFPFIRDPCLYLKELWNGASDNKSMALRIFNQQRRKSSACRQATVKFHNEIAERGFVSRLSDMDEDVQEEILNAPLRHFLYWRTTFKDSVSTPARIVVDPTMSGFNDCLARGSNCLNNLYLLIVNWRSWNYAFCADLHKMYNSVRLYPSEFKFVLYLWSESLCLDEEPEIWLYKVVTYGLTSSGYVVTAALRRIASIKQFEYPLAYDALTKKCYMDDISSGANTKKEVKEIIDEVESVIPFAGFRLKVVTVSGEAPTDKASSDGVFSSFAGYKWDSKNELVKLGLGELNFNKKVRGSKEENVVPIDTVERAKELTDSVKLTRRILLGKIMEVYDPIGLFEPVKSKLKIDMKLVHTYDYDELLPDDLQVLWKANLLLIHNTRSLAAPRPFVSPIAVNPDDLIIIMTCDASSQMAGIAAYCFQQTTAPGFSTSLITARSKSAIQTIPRNELDSLVLAAETLFCLLKVLGSRVKSYYVCTDSEIALCWIHNTSLPLKQYCFNRVQHIRRLIDPERIFHIPGVLNPSDLLTRGKFEFSQLESDWLSGPSWMRADPSTWPLSTYQDICGKMNQQQQTDYEKEVIDLPASVNISSVLIDGCYCNKVLRSCHCILDDLCCYCLSSTFRTTCDKVANSSFPHSGSSSTLSYSKMQSLVLAYTRVGIDSEDIVQSFDGLHIEQPESIPDSHPSPGEPTGQPSILKFGSLKSPFLVDFVSIGFAKAMRVLSLVMRFVTKCRHLAHLSNHIEFLPNCHRCILQTSMGRAPDSVEQIRQPVGPEGVGTLLPSRNVFSSSYDNHLAWKFVCRSATKEVLSKTTESQRNSFRMSDDKILYAGGRLDHSFVTQAKVFLEPDNFTQPVALVKSDLVYALAIHLHWENNHPGVERLIFLVSKVLYVERLRALCKFIRRSCPRCRYLCKRVLKAEIENQSQLSLKSAPPFFVMQIDIASGFVAHDINTRTTKTCYLLVCVCMVTTAVNVTVVENLKTESIVNAISRHGDQFGYPKYVLPDLQSSFQTLKDLQFSFRDLQGILHQRKGVILDFCTPQHHASHGKVEIRVKLIKQVLESSRLNQFKHSLIEWETLAKRVSSFLNSLPISRSGDSRDPNDFDLFGLITPNHFLIGKNTDRVADGSPVTIDSPSIMLDKLNRTSEALQEVLLSHIHRFIPGSNDVKGQVPSVGDIVLFVLKSSSMSKNWKFGRVIGTYVNGRKSLVRICYRNSEEHVFRELERHVSDICIISHIDEVCFNTHEHKLALDAQRKYLVYHKI